MFDKDGKATFSLKHGDSIFIKDIPAGAAYTLNESVPEYYTEENNGEYTGTIVKSVTQQINVKNIYNPSHNYKNGERKPGR